MLALTAAVCFAPACAARRSLPTHTATISAEALRLGRTMRAFRNAEPIFLEQLGWDARLLERTTAKPTPAELASAEVGGHLSSARRGWVRRKFEDPFLFTDRQVSLHRVRDVVDSVELLEDSALRRDVLAGGGLLSKDPEIASLTLDQHLLWRMLQEESTRLERERDLPRGAAALVRACVVEWPLDATPADRAAMDATLAWRLGQVSDSLAPNALSEAEREDLQEALASLHVLVRDRGDMPKASAAMGHLEERLVAMWAAPYSLDDEEAVEASLRKFLGLTIPFDRLDDALARADAALRGQVQAGLSVLGARYQVRVRRRARAILLGASPCRPRAPLETTRDMAPPPERAWACSLVRALDLAHSDEQELAALLALHDGVVVARWSVSLHGAVREPSAALRRAHTILSLTRPQQHLLLAMAGARPERAIAAGLAARVVLRDGPANARARVRAWRIFGEAPYDAVEAALLLQRARGG